MGVGIGEQPSVDEQDTADAGALGVTGSAAVEAAGEQFEDHQAGVVERDRDRAGDAVRGPQGFNEVGALDGGVRVVAGFVRVALPKVLHVQTRTWGVVQPGVDLGPAVGAIGKARQHADPVPVRRGVTVDAFEHQRQAGVIDRIQRTAGRVVWAAAAAGEPGRGPHPCGRRMGGRRAGRAHDGSAAFALLVAGDRFGHGSDPFVVSQAWPGGSLLPRGYPTIEARCAWVWASRGPSAVSASSDVGASGRAGWAGRNRTARRAPAAATRQPTVRPRRNALVEARAAGPVRGLDGRGPRSWRRPCRPRRFQVDQERCEQQRDQAYGLGSHNPSLAACPKPKKKQLANALFGQAEQSCGRAHLIRSAASLPGTVNMWSCVSSKDSWQ